MASNENNRVLLDLAYHAHEGVKSVELSGEDACLAGLAFVPVPWSAEKRVYAYGSAVKFECFGQVYLFEAVRVYHDNRVVVVLYTQARLERLASRIS